ncbi:MAG TPA: hypothetical protein VFF69_08680 [Phycisphaerales bacterium]|nr:hypothetical protein [Phycisphaerales bacterium]
MPFASVPCLVKPLLAIAGVTAVAMGGYNLVATGCPLGRCDSALSHGAIPVAAPGSENSGCGTGGCSDEWPAPDTLLLTGAAPAESGLAPAECAGACPLAAPHGAEIDAVQRDERCETTCPHATPPSHIAEGQGASRRSGPDEG